MDSQTFEKLQRIYDQADSFGKKLMEKEFPELKESEDEKNIKNLIDELKSSLSAANCQNDATGGGYEKRIALLEWGISWLEKQGKEWSAEDEDAWDIAIRIIQNGGDDCSGILDSNKAISWLKSLKQKFIYGKKNPNYKKGGKK